MCEQNVALDSVLMYDRSRVAGRSRVPLFLYHIVEGEIVMPCFCVVDDEKEQDHRHVILVL